MVDQLVDLARHDEDEDYSGWFCVATDPWPCPAPACGFVANHLTAAHLIVVWPSRDDRKLFVYARDARDVGRNPRIVEYEQDMGPCIAFDEWVRIGKPIHGVAFDKAPSPDWKGERPMGGS